MPNDAVRNDPNKRPIVIPSTYIGGPRYMNEAFFKGMALVKQFGKPDLFITMTTNPNWPEIHQMLSPGQTPGQRPDVVTRVFRMKLDAMMEDITKNQILGGVTAWCYAVEYQQRGYLHAHVNIWLKNKLKSGDDVNSIISAELPPEENKPLRDAVKKFNVHGVKHFGCCGDCGGPKLSCCVNGKYDNNGCKTNPHANVNYTYRRRKNVNETDDGYKNTNVVPYNAYLTLKYNCHINAEAVCGGLATIKYMVKYRTKSARGDRNMVAVDEIGDDDVEFKRSDETLNEIYDKMLEPKEYKYMVKYLHRQW
ncbi:unnamed protein product [Bathycoccus prasinos]